MSWIPPIAACCSTPPFAARCRPRVVECAPVKEADREPVNSFTLGPIPFDKFLEKLNAIDRLELSTPRPKPCTYGPGRMGRQCPEIWKTDPKGGAGELGKVLDVMA